MRKDSYKYFWISSLGQALTLHQNYSYLTNFSSAYSTQYIINNKGAKSMKMWRHLKNLKWCGENQIKINSKKNVLN